MPGTCSLINTNNSFPCGELFETTWMRRADVKTRTSAVFSDLDLELHYLDKKYHANRCKRKRIGPCLAISSPCCIKQAFPEVEITKTIWIKSNTLVSWLVTNVDLSQIVDFFNS